MPPNLTSPINGASLPQEPGGDAAVEHTQLRGFYPMSRRSLHPAHYSWLAGGTGLAIGRVSEGTPTPGASVRDASGEAAG
jgi:hypothetical protein